AHLRVSCAGAAAPFDVRGQGRSALEADPARCHRWRACCSEVVKRRDRKNGRWWHLPIDWSTVPAKRPVKSQHHVPEALRSHPMKTRSDVVVLALSFAGCLTDPPGSRQPSGNRDRERRSGFIPIGPQPGKVAAGPRSNPMSSAFIERNPGVRRHARAAAAAGLAMTLAAACGGSGGGSLAVDAGSGGQGGGSGGSGGPIDPGGDGGWPRLVAAGCPTLTMPTAAAGIVYVDGGATGAESGSAEAPFRTIATALASVGQSGSVWVAAGTYAENLTVPETDVVLYGGFAAGFGARTDACATILEAGDAARPVLTASASVKSFGLDGVTVRGGARGLSVAGEASVGARFSI